MKLNINIFYIIIIILFIYFAYNLFNVEKETFISSIPSITYRPIMRRARIFMEDTMKRWNIRKMFKVF